MELLNIQFAILIVKVSLCVVPIAVGVAMISRKEEGKREMRNWICNRLFGVSNAIDYPKFSLVMKVAGGCFVFVGIAAIWVLFVMPHLAISGA